jgi:ABC-type glycerol-3-phosphate transport system substrate-binding protein
MALTLGSCGTDEPPSGGDQPTTPVNTGATGATDTPVTGDITVTSWRFADPSEIGQLHVRLLEEFNAAQSDIKVTIDPVPYNDVNTNLINSVLGNSPSDLVAISPSELASNAEYLQPIDSYWEAEGPEFAAAFGDAAKALASHDGHVYGVAIEQSTTDGMWYNTEVLAAAGVDPEQAVSSWDNFVAALHQVQDAGFTPMLFEAANPSRMDRHWAWYVAGGADLSDPASYVAQMCSPASQQTFEWLADLHLSGLVPNPAGIGYEESTRQFAAGGVGFYTDGPWEPATFAGYDASIVDKVGYTHLPPKTEGGPLGANIDGLLWVIPKGSPNPDAAWEVIKYMSSEEAQKRMVANNQIPTRVALLDDPVVVQNATLSFFAQLINDWGFARPRATYMPEFKQTFIEGFQAAVTGQQTPADAFQSTCDRLANLS